VDPKWGEVDCIFPWAVYEAKAAATTKLHEEAKEQIFLAAQVYLGMLDDLARNPYDLQYYQNSDSKEYQVFLTTACGPEWIIYVAYNFFRDCVSKYINQLSERWSLTCLQTIEPIWEGNIRNEKLAIQLLCIIDQIHEWALTSHRNFVIQHLEPWLKGFDDKFEEALRKLMQLQAPERSLEEAELLVADLIGLPEWNFLKAEKRW
jgi:hypothetical protein